MRMLRRELRTVSEEVDDSGSWAISYGDMVTLLLMFFLLFFNLDNRQIKQNHFKLIQSELMGRLESLVPSKSQRKEKERVQPSQASSTQASQLKDSGVEIDQKLIQEMGAKISKRGQKLVIEFPEVSFYGFSKKKVTREGAQALRRFTQIYLPFAGNFKLSVRAFTDSVPVVSRRLGYSDNLELSALRSISAMRVLQKAGVPLNRMRIAGAGEFSAKDLSQSGGRRDLTSSKNGVQSRGDSAARKIVLMIEPAVEELL